MRLVSVRIWRVSIDCSVRERVYAGDAAPGHRAMDDSDVAPRYRDNRIAGRIESIPDPNASHLA